jgi:hypothetical protein
VASDSVFPIFAQGEIERAILDDFRVAVLLSGTINPDTKKPFTSLELAEATARGSLREIDARVTDLVLLTGQQRAIWLADQVRPDRASTSSLQTYFASMWRLPFLAAAGGSGTVTAKGASGTIFFGSTTIGDPNAIVGTSDDNKRFQVLFTAQIPSGQDSVPLTVIGVDTGLETNLEPGVEITWTNPPVGALTKATVLAKFTGGIGAETDQQYVQRFLRNLRHKQGAGNRAQIRALADQAANNALDSLFVYACARHAGSTIVVPVQKRSTEGLGPNGRAPSAGLLAILTAYLAPPGSPVLPAPPFLVVVAPQLYTTDLLIDLSMAVGSDVGWADFFPWPKRLSNAAPAITALTSQTVFKISSPGGGLPSGVTAPKLMAWDATTSRFEALTVASVSLNAGVYDVVLVEAPEMTLTIGTWISPLTQLHPTIARTVELYYDSLGPGQILDVSPTSIDPRRARSYRFPKPSEEYPERIGAGVLTFLQDAFGATIADMALGAAQTTLGSPVSIPPIPTDPIDGPNLFVAGRLSLTAV